MPFVDLDFIVVEYDMRKAMALIDYKRETAPWPPDMKDANIEAQVDMATRGRVPFFIVRYGIDIDWFVPWCASDLAHKGWAAYHQKRLSEVEFVRFLYELRARDLPPAVEERLRKAA